MRKYDHDVNVKVRQKDCNFKKLWRKSIFMHKWVLRNGVFLVYLILMFKIGKKGSPLLLMPVFAYMSVTHACDVYMALHTCHQQLIADLHSEVSTCSLTFRRLKSASPTGFRLDPLIQLKSYSINKHVSSLHSMPGIAQFSIHHV